MSKALRKGSLEDLVAQLRGCTLCPGMQRPAVSGGPVWSRVITVGQAPGSKEPVLGRPFAWTAGKTLFRWFHEALGIDETEFRSRVYMAAVCRCFPGKNAAGGDRVPDSEEISVCSRWLQREVELLEPELVIPIGKLAISQFMEPGKLSEVIGRAFRVRYAGREFDMVPLPHPSGASPWHRTEPGRSLLREALALIAQHPVWHRD